MFGNCLDFCSAPVLLFQRDQGRHQSEPTERSPHNSKIPEKVSLRSAKSLKFVKSTKSLLPNAAEPLSPRVSLKTIDSTQKNSSNTADSLFLEAFRNPFQNTENSTSPANRLSSRRDSEIRVHFSFEPPASPRHSDRPQESLNDPAELPSIQVHNEHDSLVSPSEASSVVFGAPLLSTIREEEKEDLKSTHFSGQRLLPRGSIIKPKSVVSMMSSNSEADSVLLERTVQLDRLMTLF